jgi:hypothetical protein
MFNPKIDGATTIKSKADAAAVYNRKKVADDLIGDSRKNHRESFDKSNAAKAAKNKLSRERNKLIEEKKTASRSRKTEIDIRLKELDDQIAAQKQIIDSNRENASQYKA